MRGQGEGEAMWWEGVRVEEGQGGGGVNENKNKKIIEDISQAEAGLLRQTMLIEE